MVNKRKKKTNEPISEERKQYLREYRQQVVENAPKKPAVSEPLPPCRHSTPKDPHSGCPVCPGTSADTTSNATVPLDQQVLEADVTIPVTSAIRSRPILRATRRFSYHHRKLSLSAQRRPQSLGSGLRQGLIRRVPMSKSEEQPDIEENVHKHSASKSKLSAYLRRAKRKFSASRHAPLITRPVGYRVMSCIQLENSVKGLACGGCGTLDQLVLEESSNYRGWATFFRWKCKKCQFATDWTSSSPRITPKGPFEVLKVFL